MIDLARWLARLGPAALLVAAGLACGPAKAASKCKLGELAQLPITMVGSRPTIPAKIGGHDVTMFIDSGAQFGTLASRSTKELGLHPMYAPGYTLKGVGGQQTLMYSRVDQLTLAGIPLKGIDFFVAEGGIESGVVGVIGQNILGAFDTEYDFANGVVRLFKPENCGDADFLAYWSDGKANVVSIEDTPRDQRHIVSTVMVNGQRMKALWDSGAPRSVMNKRSAARAGVTPTSAGAQFAGQVGGFGSRRSDSWIAPFASFAVGDEKIMNTRLRFMDADAGEQDMLLGFDFFLSHRIFVANSQRKVYFTYNGGPVFRLDMAQVAEQNARERAEQDKAATALPAPAGQAEAAAKADAASSPDEPKDAAGYVRRAAAFRARLNYPAAIADLTKAIALEPADPDHYLQRAQVFAASNQPVRAMADFNEVLSRKPGSIPALIGRGVLYAASRDAERARADLSAAMKGAPGDRVVPLTVAGAYLNMGFTEDAQAVYDRWLLDHPKAPSPSDDASGAAQSAAALNGACWTRAILRKELDAALADCDAAVKLQPKSAAILDSRGLVHFDRGEYDKAIADYDAALALAPKVAMTLYARAVAKARKGMTEQADADAKAAVAINARVADQARRFGLTMTPPPSQSAALQ